MATDSHTLFLTASYKSCTMLTTPSRRLRACSAVASLRGLPFSHSAAFPYCSLHRPLLLNMIPCRAPHS